MNTKQPKINILRSAKDGFIGAYPAPGDYPEKYPSENAFMTGSVASANDCTGIAVTIPETEEEAESLSSLRDIPVTSKDGGSAN